MSDSSDYDYEDYASTMRHLSETQPRHRKDAQWGASDGLRPDIPLESVTTEVVVVDTTAAACQAVASLCEKRRCAMDCEGESLSRKGKLHLLAAAGEGDQQVYVFDMQTLGQEGCDASGLKAWMENPGISKLMWDCREDADALLHQFSTTLRGVCDLQLADVLTRADDEPRRLSRLGGIVPPGSLRAEGKMYAQQYRLLALKDMISNPSGKRTRVCTFANRGQCRYGAICAFAHSPDELADKSSGGQCLRAGRLTGAMVSELVSRRPLRRDVLIYASADILMLHKAFELLQQRTVPYEESVIIAASAKYCDQLRKLPARKYTIYESSSLLPCAVLTDICPALGHLRCDQCSRPVGTKRKHREIRCGPCNTLFRWRDKDDDGSFGDDGRGYGLLDSEGNEI